MIGRHDVLQRLSAALTDRGRVVLLEGAPGVGKSTLVDELEMRALTAGATVLRCGGAEHGPTYPFAVLHELLHPVLHYAEQLAPRHRDALLAATWAGTNGIPNRLLVGLGTVGLIGLAASQAPLLLIVEDAQWLDAASAHTLMMVARRLAGPVLLVATARPGAPFSELLDTDLDARVQRIHLTPLELTEATQLLDALGFDLGGAIRSRVLEEAAGNPLAITELATALAASTPPASSPSLTLLPPRLPTTRRLQSAFGVDVGSLSPSARTLALLAACGTDQTSLAELLAAAHDFGAGVREVAELTQTGLVDVDSGRLRFAHPLMRSAVYGACSTVERNEAHQALAFVTADPVVAAWHRGASTSHRDHQMSEELARNAEVARLRGDFDQAIAALHRAADLAPTLDDQVHHSLAAAETARQAGQADKAAELVADVLPHVRSARDAVHAAVTESLLEIGTGRGVLSIDELITLANRQFSGDVDGQPARTELLALAAERAWALGVHPVTLSRLRTELLRPTARPTALHQRLVHLLETNVATEERLAAISMVQPSLASPSRSGPGRSTESHSDCSGEPGPGASEPGRNDGHAARREARLAEFTHDLRAATLAWDACCLAHDTGHSPADEAQALEGRAVVRYLTGDLFRGLDDCERAATLAMTTQSPRVRAGAAATAALIHAARGDFSRAHDELRLARTLSDRGEPAMLRARIRWAAGVVALSEGRHSEAWFELSDAAAHGTIRVWSLADLAEAGARCGRGLVARAAVDAEMAASPGPRPAFASALVARAAAVLGGDEPEAERFFREALDHARDAGANLDHARTQLMFGEWLRRQRRVFEARDQLGPALLEFDRRGAAVLSARARAEMSAAGVGGAGDDALTTAMSDHPLLALLTPQESKVAQLAAAGLSNRDIAEQVMLSSRTVGAHLYRAFPKLGVSNRAQLANLLAVPAAG